MSETLWITLPIYEENALKEVLNLIVSKNLTNLSINQLIEKIQNYQAADWLEVLGQYNSISSINNIDLSQILNRAISVKNKFDRKNRKNQIIYPNLKNQSFTPNQLLSLVVLCYSNPNLIGPNLCEALNEGDEANIKKEILENSARVEDRIAPWASNLRLANYAFYANDTAIRLPTNVIDRVTRETIQKGLIVRKVDQRGGYEEVINGPERATRGVRSANHTTELDAYQILQSLQSGEQGLSENSQSITPLSLNSSIPQIADYQFTNGSELTSQVLPLNATNNAASMNSLNGNALLVSWFLFHVAKPACNYVGSFFSKPPEPTKQPEQKFLSAAAKP
ncbi:MAG: hypothetical protein WA659_04715 [Candidatus Aquirickettsiella sp.]